MMPWKSSGIAILSFGPGDRTSITVVSESAIDESAAGSTAWQTAGLGSALA
jgi:hypothetical protein